MVVAHRAAEPALASAAWETGAVAAAFTPQAAAGVASAWGGVRGALNLMAFGAAGEFDSSGFAAAVALLSTAMSAAADERPASLGLVGVADWLVAKGLAYDSEAGRTAIRDLYRHAASACVASGICAINQLCSAAKQAVQPVEGQASAIGSVALI